jgi:uridine kinase
VIGIAGGSASGKSTFTDQLQAAMAKSNRIGAEMCIIHMDDYFKPESERPYSKAPVTGKMYVDDNHPQTMRLGELYQDLLRHISEEKFLLIIVEGLLTLWDEQICSLLDLKLFVDCRADERIVRRLKRNMEWGLSFDDIANVYLDLVRYRHDEYVEPSKWKADFILNGSNPSELSVQMIAEYIISSIKP